MDRDIPRRTFGIVVGTIFALMVIVMLQRPELYPVWTVGLLGATGLGAFWYGFGDLIAVLRSPGTEL